MTDQDRTPQRLLTPRDVAHMLGVHPQTATHWIRSGRVPGYHLHGRYYVDPEAFRQWMEEHRTDQPVAVTD